MGKRKSSKAGEQTAQILATDEETKQNKTKQKVNHSCDC
jgi:hypothetical protein